MPSHHWVTVAESIFPAIRFAGFYFWCDYLSSQPISAGTLECGKFIAVAINGAVINFKCNDLRRSSMICFRIQIADRHL
jgi:hypothetical protein